MNELSEVHIDSIEGERNMLLLPSSRLFRDGVPFSLSYLREYLIDNWKVRVLKDSALLEICEGLQEESHEILTRVCEKTFHRSQVPSKNNSIAYGHYKAKNAAREDLAG